MDKPNGHFDKYLLSFFVVFFAAAAMVMSERFKDQNLAVAMMDNVKLFVGALLGFITGATLAARRSTDPPAPAPVTTPTEPPSNG